MIVRALNKVIRPLGYEIRKPGPPKTGLASASRDYVLHSFKNPDGTFDYQRYRDVQQDGNKRKIDAVWVEEDNIKFLAKYLTARLGPVASGICHGTRRGKEQEWFKKYLAPGANIIGTEISETATQFPNTIQWDFHEVKPEWTGALDFIYSNSFDHSYDPEKCMDAWIGCLKPGGLCLLEYTDQHSSEGASELDPFGASMVQMPYLITLWGKGRYGVREILDAPVRKDYLNYAGFIVIQKYA